MNQISKLKKFFIVSLVTIFVAGFAMGCALFGVDVNYQRNQVVARIGNVTEIRRYQLIDAFNSWGFQFAQQGLSTEAAVNRTLDILIEREIMIHLATTDQFFGSAHSHGLIGSLTLVEANRARQNAFDAIERQVREINQQLRDERDMGSSNSTQDEPEAGVVFEPHQRYIQTSGTGRNRTFALDLARFEEHNADDLPIEKPICPDFNGDHTDAFIASLFEPAGQSTAEVNLARDTMNRVARLLRNNERGQGFTGAQDTNEAVIRRAIERIQRDEEKNMLQQRFRDTFSQGIMNAGHTYFNKFANRHRSEQDLTAWQDAVADRSQNHVDSVAHRARAEYHLNVQRAIDRFQRGLDTEHSIGQAIIGNIANVHWVPNSVVNNFFTVSHILVGFSDEQEAQLDILQEQLDNREITQNDFIRERNAIRSAVTVRDRDVSGREFGPELSVNQVMNIVQQNVNGSHNPQRAFRDLIYRFNSDPGMQNPDFEYTMGRDMRALDSDGNRIGDDHNSRMVEPFTIAARELRENGQQGDISGIVWSQFGAHIIMYTRDISDFIFSNSESMLMQNYERFLHATRTSYCDKTFFDALVEQITRPDYQMAEDAMINTFKQQLGRNGITVFERTFRDMWR